MLRSCRKWYSGTLGSSMFLTPGWGASLPKSRNATGHPRARSALARKMGNVSPPPAISPYATMRTEGRGVAGYVMGQDFKREERWEDEGSGRRQCRSGRGDVPWPWLEQF